MNLKKASKEKAGEDVTSKKVTYSDQISKQQKKVQKALKQATQARESKSNTDANNALLARDAGSTR